MAQAPTSFADIERFLREMPYLTAKLHGAKYRFMYQVYASPKYRECGKEFFKGVNIRYHNYAELLSGKLGMPADFIQGMTYLFVRACVDVYKRQILGGAMIYPMSGGISRTRHRPGTPRAFMAGLTARQIVLSVRSGSATTRRAFMGSRPLSRHSTDA